MVPNMHSEKWCLINDCCFGLKITAERKMLKNITSLERLDPNNCLELERLQKGKLLWQIWMLWRDLVPKKVLFISMALKRKRMKQIWMIRSSLVPKMTAQRKMTLTMTASKAMSQILPWTGIAPKGKDIVPNMNNEKIFALKKCSWFVWLLACLSETYMVPVLSMRINLVP